MANVQSNPISEYDFTEFPEEITPEQELEIQSIVIQRMEPNLLMVLNGFQLDREVFERFADSGIKYSQLAGLSNEDLEMFGVPDKNLQDEMLSDFKNLEGQESYFESAMHYLREPKAAARQEMSVIDLIQTQLISMNTLLAATIIKIGATKSSQSPGVVVNNNFNSPEVVVELLEKMTSHTQEMTDLIRLLKDEREMERKKNSWRKQSIKNNFLKTLLVASGVLLGIVIAKHLRG